jgi:hypothetical protein
MGSKSFSSPSLENSECLIYRECRPIVDADGIVVGVLGAIPKDEDQKDESWKDVCHSAVAAIEETRGRLHATAKQKEHPRGSFTAFAVGLSHGGGQLVGINPVLLLSG